MGANGGSDKDLPIQSSLGKYAQGTFDSRNIQVDENGNFEFILGPIKPESGQWWQAESDAVLLMIRDIFLDHTICSITHTFLSPFQRIDKKIVAELVLNFFGKLLDSYVESQSKLNPDGFLDVDYREIISDPIDCVRRAYEKNSGGFTKEQEAAVKARHQNNKQGKHGTHNYSAEEFGLSHDMIRERSKKYLDYYNI